jgi:hypothetical protein
MDKWRSVYLKGLSLKLMNFIFFFYGDEGKDTMVLCVLIPSLCSNPFLTVLRIRIRMFLGLSDPEPVVRGMDPDLAPDPSLFS